MLRGRCSNCRTAISPRYPIVEAVTGLEMPGDRLLALGEQMEQAFIWDPPDLRTATTEEVAAWWKAAVMFPEDFSYQRAG